MLPKLKQRLKRLLKRGKPQAGPSPEQHDRAALPTHPPDVQESSIVVLGPPTTSSAPTFVQPTAPDLEVTQPSLPKRLWNEAYDNLKDEQPELVDAYERILSRELRGDLCPADKVLDKNEIDQTNPETRRIQFDQILQSGLKKTAREAAVKQNIQEAMGVIDSVKGWIDAAVKLAPEAAIAWTGVCFALEILASPIDEAVANRDGITYVISRMDWYWNLAYFLDEDRGDKSSGLRGHLEHQIIDLYKNLLSYQTNSICLYYRNRFLAFLRDVVKLDDWENTLQSIKDLETSIQRDFDTFTNSEINDRLQRLAATADSIHSDIYQAIQKQTATQEEMQQKEKNNECLAALRVTDPCDDKTNISCTKGGLHQESSNWILKHDDFDRWYDNDEARVLWVKGDPGKGKTMLLITIVDELEKRACPKSSPSTILSYFFCQGTNSSHNNASAVLRGLIYRLGYQKQSLISHLREKYDKSGRNLFSDENAFFALAKILEDILQDADLSRAYIVIDALDECEKELEQLLEFIVRNLALVRVKWVISSRNRKDIEQQLELENSGTTLSLELAQNAKQVSHAINAYIDFKIPQVKYLREDSMLRAQVRDSIRQKANGTFLWAALVIQQLKKVDEWDALYMIEKMPNDLKGIYDRMMDQIDRYEGRNQRFCKLVLSAATVAYRPLRLTEMAVLSGLPKDISSDLSRVSKVVARCGSFLTVREDYVYLIHQSAKDYLGRKDGNPFYIELINVHRDVFSRSLEVMFALRRNIYNLKSPGLPINQIEAPNPNPLAAMRYPCVYWIDHFCDFYSNFSGRSRPEGDDKVNRFLREKAIYWLEAMSLIQCLDDAIFAIKKLESFSEEQSSNPELLEIVRDLHRFMLQNAWVIRTAPLQTYASALIFSPADCLTRKIFQNEEPKWVTLKPRVQSYWSPLLQTFEGHKMSIISVVFSHDSKLLASCSYESTIRIWHTESGSLKHTLDNQGDFPFSIVFSHDSTLLASGSHGHTIRIWHTSTGSLKQTLATHGDASDYSSCSSVTFSDNSKLLASTSSVSANIWCMETGSLRHTFHGRSDNKSQSIISFDFSFLVVWVDHIIEIWDVRTGSLTQTFDTVHSFNISSIQLSLDSKYLAVGSIKGTIQIWSIETGSQQHTYEGHTGPINSISLSHDFKRLASSSMDGTTKTWNIETEALQETFKSHTWPPSSVTFSRDSKILAVGSHNSTIDILDISTTFPSNRSLEDEAHSTKVLFIRNSYDSTLLASESKNTIKIWDATTGSLRQTLDKTDTESCQMVFSSDSKYFAVMIHKSITIWDTVTWSIKHTLNVDHELQMASFDDTGLRLNTETGRIELSRGARDSMRIQVSPQTIQHQANGAGYGINDDKSWITWNGNNILWLPLEYRPNKPIYPREFEGYLISSLEPPSKGSTNVIVALGCRSNRVIIIGLDSSGPLDVQ